MVAGILLAFLFLPLTDASYLLLFVLSVVAIGPMAVDGVTQLLGWRKSDNYLRFLTGGLAGAVIGIDIAALLADAPFL